MHIGLDTDVICEGNTCGVSRHLIIHPQRLCLTHLVISAKHLERMLPVSTIVKVSEMGIQLNCTLGELAKFQPFTETHFTEITLPDHGLSEHNYLYPLSGGQSWMHVPVISYNIPLGAFVISRQTQVEAKNGHVGQFKALIIDPETYQITHLVFQRGHLWEYKNEVVSASDIDRLEGDSIYLKVNKADL